MDEFSSCRITSCFICVMLVATSVESLLQKSLKIGIMSQNSSNYNSTDLASLDMKSVLIGAEFIKLNPTIGSAKSLEATMTVCSTLNKSPNFVGFILSTQAQLSDTLVLRNTMLQLGLPLVELWQNSRNCPQQGIMMKAVKKWLKVTTTDTKLAVIYDEYDSCLHPLLQNTFKESKIIQVFTRITQFNSVEKTLTKLRFRQFKLFILLNSSLQDAVLKNVLYYETWLFLFKPKKLLNSSTVMNWNTKTTFVTLESPNNVSLAYGTMLKVLSTANVTWPQTAEQHPTCSNSKSWADGRRLSEKISTLIEEQHKVSFRTIIPHSSDRSSYLHGLYHSNTLNVFNKSHIYGTYNLRNITLKFLYSENEPYIFIDKRTSKLSGVCIDILDGISNMINFSYELVNKKQLRNQNVSLTWSGVIDLVNLGYADIGGCDITVTANRTQLVDFSVPWTEEYLAIVIAKPKDKSLLKVFRPFTYISWLSVSVAVIAVGVIIAILSWLSPLSMYNLLNIEEEKRSVKDEISPLQNIWCILGTLLQQGQDFYPFAYSSRTVTVFWWVSSMALVATYTAKLVSALTVPDVDAKVNTIQQLADAQYYKVMVPAGGNTELTFKNGGPGTAFQRISQSSERFHPILHGKADPYKIVAESDDAVWAFITDGSKLEYDSRNNCSSLLILPDRFWRSSLAFPLAKNGHFHEAFNFAMVRLLEVGFVHRLRQYYWRKQKLCSSTKPTHLDLHTTAGAFLITAVFFVLAFVTLSVELMWRRVHPDKRPPQRTRTIDASAITGTKVTLTTALPSYSSVATQSDDPTVVNPTMLYVVDGVNPVFLTEEEDEEPAASAYRPQRSSSRKNHSNYPHTTDSSPYISQMTESTRL